MRNIVTFSLIALLFGAALIPMTWNRPMEMEPKSSVRNTRQDNEAIHIPEKINYISQVRQTVESLNHSPKIMTIHHNSRDKSHAIRREVTVKFKVHPNEAELAKINQAIDGKMKKHWDSYWIFKSQTKETEELIRYFTSRKDVAFAEPNYLLLPNRMPNDPLYTRYQYNLPLIKADEAWDINLGKSNIVVAVVDTGVDLNHKDFKDKLVTGYNVLTDTNDPLDDNGHGTHVAGIISASTNNTIGIAGVSWNNKIMPIKAIGAEGTGSSFDIAKGIRWATDHGAHVINMSVGNYHPSGILQDAIRYAYNKGVVLVAASGNDNTSQPSYPAAYPEVISVAAVDQQAQRAEFSNYGDYIEVAAPGVDIPSTYIYDEYAALSGTSMACPHVAGLAGLILSVNPKLTNEEVRAIIRNTSVDAGPTGKDSEYGHGMINVANALQMTLNQGDTQPKTVPPAEEERPTGWANRLLFKMRLGDFRDLFAF